MVVVLLVPVLASARSLRAPRRVKAGGLVTFSARFAGEGGDRVAVQRRAGRVWRVEASGRASRRGVFSLTAVAPDHATTLSVRAVALRRGRVVSRTGVRRVRVLALPKGTSPVVVSSHTAVLPASVVSSVPAPGQPGKLTYTGGNSVQPGSIVAIGVGPNTPDGFLGRVTGVSQQDGQTVASTAPATLLEAVPTGSLDAVASSGAASSARARTRRIAESDATVTCKGSADASIEPNFDPPHATFELKGDWSLFHGLQSASLTANASTDASITATVSAAGSCALGDTQIVSFPGPSVDTFVGPVPVVMTSKVSVDVDAKAQTSGSVKTGASIGFSASAGIGWSKQGGFSPIHSFTPKMSYTAPALSADASLDADITPTLDVLLYGVAGPQVALKAGLAFDADVNGNPWWTLGAPVDLTAKLAVPALNLSSPTLHVYQHTFPLANAAGSFGGGLLPPAPGGQVLVTNPGNQSNTVGDGVDLPIKATETNGGSLTYSATGLPDGLHINASTGIITGSPTTAANSSVTVKAADASSGVSDTATFLWSVLDTASPPDTDRPTVLRPTVPEAAWSEPMGDGAAIIPDPVGGVITSGGDSNENGITNAADTPFNLQSVGSDGSEVWRRPDDDGEDATVDSSGNTYYMIPGDGTAYILSVNSTGHVRWTSAALPEDSSGYTFLYDTRAALGFNGEVYFTLYDGFGHAALFGINETTGAVDVDASLGFPTFVRAYSGGLVVGDAGGLVEYLNYDGSVQSSYPIGNIDLAQAQWSVGADGSVFVMGPETEIMGCSSSGPALNVVKVTPTGPAWTWTEPDTTDCLYGFPTAAPDGGVVLEETPAENPDAGDIVSLSSSGGQLWRSTESSNVTGESLFPTNGVLVDSTGVVVVPIQHSYDCTTISGGTCVGLDLSFLSDSSGATALPTASATDEGSSPDENGWGQAIAMAAGRVYLDASTTLDVTTYPTNTEAVAAMNIAGLSEDYQASLEP
jgi:Putative Ig domain